MAPFQTTNARPMIVPSPSLQIISIVDIVKPSSLESFKEVYRGSPRALERHECFPSDAIALPQSSRSSWRPTCTASSGRKTSRTTMPRSVSHYSGFLNLYTDSSTCLPPHSTSSTRPSAPSRRFTLRTSFTVTLNLRTSFSTPTVTSRSATLVWPGASRRPSRTAPRRAS